MTIYAVLNKDTNSVVNIINAEDEKFIFLGPDEYYAVANRAIRIGMLYDKQTGTFPEVGDRGELLDLRDEVESLILSHQFKIGENSHMTPEQLEPHINYLDQLRSISPLDTYIKMKSQFDVLGPEPEFPPAPKEITQDVFRSVLNLSEKILWDNPETGTSQQKAIITTLKMDFPHYGVENMSDELSLLEQVEFFTPERLTEVTQALS